MTIDFIPAKEIRIELNRMAKEADLFAAKALFFNVLASCTERFVTAVITQMAKTK